MKFRIQSRIRGRDRFKVEGTVEYLFKNMVFLKFWLNFLTGGSIMSQNGEMEVLIPFRDILEKFSPKAPKIEHFSIFYPIFHLSLPTYGMSTSMKVLFSNVARIELSAHKV